MVGWVGREALPGRLRRLAFLGGPQVGFSIRQAVYGRRALVTVYRPLEIAQHLLGSRERRLAVDYPVDAPQRGDEALERPLLGKPGMGVEERQLAAVVRIHEHRQHLAAKQARQHVDMHEEVGA